MSHEAFIFCPRCATPLADIELPDDGGVRVRRACPNTLPTPCGFVQWRNPVPAVAAIVEHNGEIILARNAVWPAGTFALITGYLERNEEPTDGVKREVKEELNLDGEIVELVGVYEFMRMNQVIIAYHVRAKGEIQLSEELIDYKRVKAEDIKPWPMGTGQAVKNWQEKRGIFNETVQLPGRR